MSEAYTNFAMMFIIIIVSVPALIIVHWIGGHKHRTSVLSMLFTIVFGICITAPVVIFMINFCDKVGCH